MKVKVSDVAARFLADRGVTHAFGISGAGCLHLFDSVVRLGRTELVNPHHEQAATMAAHGYHFACGRPGAAILTTGGGAANGITGVLAAWMDSVPMLVLSGNENSKHTRPDNPLRVWGVQGFDVLRAVGGMTKYAARVTDPARIRYELEAAWHHTTTGRRGPVWLDIPLNVQSAVVEEDDLAGFDPPADPAPPLDRAAVAAVVRELRSAERPVLWLGQGVRYAGAAHLVAELVDRLRVPVLVSWSGLDLLDAEHPRAAGRAGVFGQRAGNFTVQNCDYLLAVGTRLAVPMVGYEIGEFARAAKIAVVDVDPAELAKYRERYDRPILADAREFLEALLGHLRAEPVQAPAAWLDRVAGWRERYPAVGPEHQDADGFLNAYRFIARLPRYFKPDQLIVTDAGTAAMATHAVMRVTPPQRLGFSFNLGEMGWGMPGAVGASFATGRGEVVCLNCDGSMMMNLQELQTIAHHRLPIKLIVISNEAYSSIKLSQRNLFQGRLAGSDPSSGVSCPDFVKLAGVFGMPAWAVRTWEDVDRVIPAMLAHDGPCLCEVFVHPDQPFQPKLGVALKDGVLVSPPLEDLGPLLPRDELRANMLVGLHPKSEGLA
jgi:acetolactate synthase-1/2/3 large subunit